MKKWILVFVCVLLFFVGYKYRPMNLREWIERNSNDSLELRVSVTTITGETSRIIKSKTYKLSSEDVAYEEVLDILEKYTYHRSVFHDISPIIFHPGMVGEVSNPSIGVGDLHLSEDFCMIGELSCAIGYRKDEEEKLRNEIAMFLEAVNLDYLYRRVTIENNETVDDYSKKFWADYK